MSKERNRFFVTVWFAFGVNGARKGPHGQILEDQSQERFSQVCTVNSLSLCSCPVRRVCLYISCVCLGSRGQHHLAHLEEVGLVQERLQRGGGVWKGGGGTWHTLSSWES